ncbi:MPN domain-containing protein-like isoform X2 [Halichondria panicea]|uniref:MPN domain-containing protein-like isoform X2 n=1 Tax=Halichondria panicea TaxID=6063 RepID=UPI00312BB740
MAGSGRSRLSMFELIQDGILTPGEKLLTFDYMGHRCEADLLPDGLIQWEGSTYSSPYAWASQCKNLVNPDHKSGIGWGHIRYRGIKLSQYKSVYLKRHRLTSADVQDSFSAPDTPSPTTDKQLVKKRRRRKQDGETSSQQDSVAGGHGLPSNQVVQVGNGGGQSSVGMVVQQPVQTVTPESYIASAPVLSITTSSTPELLQCTPFETLGLQQPFEVRVSSNALMMMDFHAHLNVNEVMGYLGGAYHSDTKCLEALQVFPCRCDINDLEETAKREKEIQEQMLSRGLELVGWYHSHPVSLPNPSHNDILSQRMYQYKMMTSGGEEPCVGVVVGPNHGGKREGEVSLFEMFWVLMVQGDDLRASPMKLSYSTQWEQYLTQEIVDEMNALVAYYNTKQATPEMKAVWKENIFFVNKLKKSLGEVRPRFPGENFGDSFLTYIDQLMMPK